MLAEVSSEDVHKVENKAHIVKFRQIRRDCIAIIIQPCIPVWFKKELGIGSICLQALQKR